MNKSVETRPVYDISAIRARFPSLMREVGGRTCLFTDAPGGTQVPENVVAAMARYLTTSNANTYGAFVTSRETEVIVDAARQAAADLVGAESDEVVFGQNATTLVFALSRSIGRSLGSGDEVLVSRLDHDANIRPWIIAAHEAGASVRWIDVLRDDVTLDMASFDAALTERTRVVAITYASNAVGSITPVTEIVRTAHNAGATVVVDAVHGAQHRALDVRALDADVLVCSAYKVFGPHLGLMFAKRDLLAKWTPYKLLPASEDVPFRWETGTLNYEGLAGLVATIDYLVEVGRTFGAPISTSRRHAVVAAFDAITEHENRLSEVFLAGARDLEKVSLYGIAESTRVRERTPTFAFRMGAQPPSSTAKALGERGVFCWDGDFYALELMRRLGLAESGGVARIGFCHYNSVDEVVRVLEEFATLAR